MSPLELTLGKEARKLVGLVEFCYNSTMHSMTNMSPLELTLGKEARKPMDLSHPHGMKRPFQKVVEMVEGHEELYT
jgi:hypothetical protein